MITTMPRRLLRRMLHLLGMVALVTSATLVTGVAPAHAATSGYFVFNKNWTDPTNSTLTWYVSSDNGGAAYTWRAGSGLGSTDECYKDHGWLPNGWYSVKLHYQYDGSLIKGVAFQLSDKTCSNGSAQRTELFIHSEMDKDGTQGSTEPRRWDGDSDFKSGGCIKLRPDAIKEAANLFDKIYSPGTTYSNKLQVVS
ncbi:hypothetical protein ACH47V_31695 [Micromonospora chersina]|uniref:hypothetical protein n=1 Tax=Micromonospora chersina TaxID=47854 RepID=UPI003403058A